MLVPYQKSKIGYYVDRVCVLIAVSMIMLSVLGITGKTNLERLVDYGISHLVAPAE